MAPIRWLLQEMAVGNIPSIYVIPTSKRTDYTTNSTVHTTGRTVQMSADNQIGSETRLRAFESLRNYTEDTRSQSIPVYAMAGWYVVGTDSMEVANDFRNGHLVPTGILRWVPSEEKLKFLQKCQFTNQLLLDSYYHGCHSIPKIAVPPVCSCQSSMGAVWLWRRQDGHSLCDVHQPYATCTVSDLHSRTVNPMVNHSYNQLNSPTFMSEWILK